LVDFNNGFKGFDNEEDILVDTGILLALFNKNDGWFTTVNGLFEKYVFNNDNAIFLYVNPCIINETTYLAKKPFDRYLKSHPTETFSEDEIVTATDNIINEINELVKNEVLMVLDGNKDTVLKQIELCKYMGDADSLNVSIANEYGISLLTVDNRLVNDVNTNKDKLQNINNIYYTIPKYRDYR
jgi:predicted nucleic acid-binding protein